MISLKSFRPACRALAAVFIVFWASAEAGSQALSIQPVKIFLSSGQRATTLSVTNTGSNDVSTQIRIYAWEQGDGDDQLINTDAVAASPPMASISAGATQVFRIILRQLPQNREAAYRILLDQIPPPAQPGTISMVLRMSIPVFVAPRERVVPQVEYRIERAEGKIYLVGTNKGLCHEAIHDVAFVSSGGRALKMISGGSLYILAGATRRWPIDARGYLPQSGENLQLTAHAETGDIKQQVRVSGTP